jgi:hypothetical protein
MKKGGLLFLIVGISVLLMSSGAGAVSVGLVDGDHNNEVILDFTNLNPGYNLGYLDGSGFHNLVPGPLITGTQDFIGVSEVNFVLQTLSDPTSIFDAATVIYTGETAGNVYHVATLQFSNLPSGVAVAAAQNFPTDGLHPATPSPEPATLLLLSSMMGVGYCTLRKKLSNVAGERAV